MVPVGVGEGGVCSVGSVGGRRWATKRTSVWMKFSMASHQHASHPQTDETVELLSMPPNAFLLDVPYLIEAYPHRAYVVLHNASSSLIFIGPIFSFSVVHSSSLDKRPCRRRRQRRRRQPNEKNF